MTFEERRQLYRRMTEQALEAALPMPAQAWPAQGVPHQLTEAMRYSLLGGGKRLRPTLLLAAYEAAGGTAGDALAFAAGVEMIHTYSLIHDDLPAMDNDDLRRGKPTSHIAFGEALAILAGDALLNLAYETMLASAHPFGIAAMRELSGQAGASGMIAGQCADIAMEGRQVDATMLNYVHERKTGALFKASVVAGLLLAGASPTQLHLGEQYAQHLGLAFQIVDDMLDILGEQNRLGKTTGKDEGAGKLTWPAVHGLDAARLKARELVHHAAELARQINPEDAFLSELAISTLERVE